MQPLLLTFIMKQALMHCLKTSAYRNYQQCPKFGDKNIYFCPKFGV